MNLAEMEQTMGLYAAFNQSHPTLVSYGEDGYLYLERNAYVRGETLIGLEHYDKHMKRAAHTGNERINNQSLEDVVKNSDYNIQKSDDKIEIEKIKVSKKLYYS